MRKLTLPLLALLFASLAVAEVSEKIQKKLDSAETTYKAAIEKADNARFYAVQKAAADRVKVLKQAITEATKSGDLDGANKLKELVTAVESGSVRPKPKDVAKFGGHEYAIVQQNVPWHFAKRICEQMGGHLVTLESPAEVAFIADVCRKANTTVWIGATDEETEGKWLWTNGQPVKIEFSADDANGAEHALMFWAPTGTFADTSSDNRVKFVCEWDK